MIDGEQVFERPHLNVGDSSVESNTRFRELTLKAFRYPPTFFEQLESSNFNQFDRWAFAVKHIYPIYDKTCAHTQFFQIGATTILGRCTQSTCMSHVSPNTATTYNVYTNTVIVLLENVHLPWWCLMKSINTVGTFVCHMWSRVSL